MQQYRKMDISYT